MDRRKVVFGIKKSICLLGVLALSSLLLTGCGSTTNITYEMKSDTNQSSVSQTENTEKKSEDNTKPSLNKDNQKEADKSSDDNQSNKSASSKVEDINKDTDHDVDNGDTDHDNNDNDQPYDDTPQEVEEDDDRSYAEDGKGYAEVVDEDDETDESTVELKDVHVIDEFNYFYGKNSFVDSFGNEHNGYHCILNGIDESYVIFNLNGEYIKLTGSLVIKDEDESSSKYNIEMFVDNKRAFSKKGITKTTGEINFDIDVANCSELKIVTTGYPITGAGIRIVDAILER